MGKAFMMYSFGAEGLKLFFCKILLTKEPLHSFCGLLYDAIKRMKPLSFVQTLISKVYEKFSLSKLKVTLRARSCSFRAKTCIV